MAERSTAEQRHNLMIDHDGAGPNRDLVRRIITEHEAMEKALRAFVEAFGPVEERPLGHGLEGTYYSPAGRPIDAEILVQARAALGDTMTFRREPVTAQHPRCDIPFAGSLGRVKEGAQAQGRAAPTSAASRQGILLPPAPAGRPHRLGSGPYHNGGDLRQRKQRRRRGPRRPSLSTA